MLKQSASQTVGPFFHIGLIDGNEHILVQDATQGERINIFGYVLDGDSVPVNDAMIEIWQADANGIYASPNDPRHAEVDAAFDGFGRSCTTDQGQYSFKTIKPGRVPYDETQTQAPHILVRVFMRGTLLHTVTRLYFSDEADANAGDPLLNMLEADVCQRLTAQRTDIEATPTYHFDIRMQGNDATPFFEP